MNQAINHNVPKLSKSNPVNLGQSPDPCLYNEKGGHRIYFKYWAISSTTDKFLKQMSRPKNGEEYPNFSYQIL